MNVTVEESVDLSLSFNGRVSEGFGETVFELSMQHYMCSGDLPISPSDAPLDHGQHETFPIVTATHNNTKTYTR